MFFFLQGFKVSNVYYNVKGQKITNLLKSKIMKHFEVISEIVNTTLASAVKTSHIKNERIERNTLIKYCIKDGILLTSFIVDENDNRGRLIHNIMSNGVIIIQNERTKRIVTQYVARSGQIVRYWKLRGMNIPMQYRGLLNIARHHEEMGYNLV